MLLTHCSRLRVATGIDKATSASYDCNATTPVGKLNSQNGMADIEPYYRTMNVDDGDGVDG